MPDGVGITPKEPLAEKRHQQVPQFEMTTPEALRRFSLCSYSLGIDHVLPLIDESALVPNLPALRL
jgi:hypothetical protein